MTDTECNLVSKVFLRECQKGGIKKLEKIRDRYKIDNWTIYRHDVYGDTGLHVAAREGHLDVVKYLCQAWEQPLYRADVTNKDMKRPLHEAAQFARSDVLQYLIEQGVQIDSLKRADWTPLMLACTKSGQNARKCIQSLLDAGADPCAKNNDGWNSLFIACRTGDAEVIKILLRLQPQCIEARSKNGRSALHIAAFHGNVIVIDEIVNADPKILHARDSSGSTAFHESSKSEISRVTERLIELGADPQALDNVGQTALHIAASCQNINTIEYILTNNLIDVNSKTQYGLTPLMAARRHKRNLAIDILTKHGAEK